MRVHILKNRRVGQALHKLQFRGQVLHMLAQKVLAHFRCVQAQHHPALRGQQLGQAANDAGIVLVRHKTAFLKTGRVHHDQTVRPHAADLAPGLEQVMRQKAGPAQTVDTVVLLPNGQRPGRHVQVDHFGGTTLQRGHRERAGIGKQVQHLLAPRLFAQPLPASGHVQKQAVVLSAQNMHAVTRQALGHDVFLGHLPCHQPGVVSTRATLLVHPAQVMAGVQLVVALLQGLAHDVEFLFLQRLEAGQDPDRAIPVQAEVFATRKAPTPTMKHTQRLACRRLGLDQGIQKCLHGQ